MGNNDYEIISEFFGIMVGIKNKKEPLIFAKYKEKECVILLDERDIKGDVLQKQKEFIIAWADLFEMELRENRDNFKKGRDINIIEV